jgi:hypothetical protein
MIHAISQDTSHYSQQAPTIQNSATIGCRLFGGGCCETMIAIACLVAKVAIVAFVYVQYGLLAAAALVGAYLALRIITCCCCIGVGIAEVAKRNNLGDHSIQMQPAPGARVAPGSGHVQAAAPVQRVVVPVQVAGQRVAPGGGHVQPQPAPVQPVVPVAAPVQAAGQGGRVAPGSAAKR